MAQSKKEKIAIVQVIKYSMVSNFLIGNHVNLNNPTYLRSITTGKVNYESDVIKLKQNTDYFDDCDT